MTKIYESSGPTIEEVEVMPGAVLLEFGTEWCGHCQAAKFIVDEALLEYPDVKHVKVEDGPGRRLGRSFQVKLWPTLVFLKDGNEVDRAVRPVDVAEVKGKLAELQ